MRTDTVWFGLHLRCRGSFRFSFSTHRGDHSADLSLPTIRTAKGEGVTELRPRTTVLFPGAPIAVVAMAITMETAKLVTTGLAGRWRATAWVTRLGVRARIGSHQRCWRVHQLVAAHVGERAAAATTVEMQTADLDARIEVASHAVADLDARVSQIDSAVAAATQRGRTTGARSIMDAQRRSRAGLTSEREQAAGTLAALKAERASINGRQTRQAEIETTPIRYVAALINPGGDDERAIRWLIALMVLCCDPPALALTAAASARGFSDDPQATLPTSSVHKGSVHKGGILCTKGSWGRELGKAQSRDTAKGYSPPRPDWPCVWIATLRAIRADGHFFAHPMPDCARVVPFRVRAK
jgi:hypothetical protein